MSRKSKKAYYVRQAVVAETQAISESVDNLAIPGPCKVPHGVRLAVEYLAHRAALDCELRNGQTALFWNLLYTVDKHIKGVKESNDAIRQTGHAEAVASRESGKPAEPVEETGPGCV